MAKTLVYKPMATYNKVIRDYLIYNYINVEHLSATQAAVLTGVCERSAQQINDALVYLSATDPKTFEMWLKGAEYLQSLYKEEK